ncbi:MAG TPA: zinc-ribbon and DUF3426 domain-containing protein [Steroidobacteraceae bacterium]|nr:zinc-ribbon and DUF3426 domain-containing protein [Steroidobacteraceae bacterium]
MFTVCPKCALTLVVTAADLRVAQGYVRCGRCSSVFNALAQLSEERQAASAGAEPTPRPPPEEPTSPASETPARTQAPEEAAAPDPLPPPERAEPESAPPGTPDDDVIPEEALEFNPEKTDVASVFVKPPPNPQWTAATGSFKSLVAANQEGAAPAANTPAPAPGPASEPAKPAPPAPAAPPAPEQSAETDGEQVDVELDAQLLADIVLGDGGASASRPLGDGPPAPPAEPLAPLVEQVAAERTPAPAPPNPPPPKAPPAASTPPGRPQHVRPPAGASPTPPHPAPAPQSPERAPLHPHARPEAPAEAAVARLRPAVALTPAELRVTLAWGIGAALLVFLLAAQVLNHHRDTLATDPRYSRPLTRLYAALGVPLAPRWDLHAYDVRQLGAAADAGSVGRITVRASVHNAATRPQPLPLLRVTLQDRFGNRIASRDVQPREYLRGMPPGALMSADERVDAQMTFVDPGTNAVGFELDACLPVSGDGITCANDASVR